MGNISKFQLVVIGIFAAAIFCGIALFAVYKGGTKKVSYDVTIWGTQDVNLMNDYISAVQTQVEDDFTFTYKQFRPETLYDNYVEAIISNTGPDVLLLPHENLWYFKDKIIPIPYTNFPERDFKSTFIQEGELYLSPQGILAMPFAVDPLVMYWNRDLFTNALIANPPLYWEDFLTLPTQLTKKDGATNIVQSAAALGEYGNISHAKEILSLLMMQAGNPITVRTNGELQTTLDSQISTPGISSANSALAFYTQFSNPIKQVYSWNRSLPNAKTYFASNRLAIYFGLASELKEIKTKNPNLNFDVALMPQRKPQTGAQNITMTYGSMMGFSIARSSKNPTLTLEALKVLTSATYIPSWVEVSGLPSVRRDARAVNTSLAESTVFATSALISRGWIEPNFTKTSSVFKNMIENVTSGRYSVDEAIQEGNGELYSTIPGAI